MVAFGKIFEQINKMQVKSITDPLFRYSAIMYALGVITAVCKASDWVTIFLFVVATFLVVLAIGFYWYHTIKSPEYLRSEMYQQNKQIIDLLGDKENSVNPNLGDLKYIASPYSRQINGSAVKQIEEGSDE